MKVWTVEGFQRTTIMMRVEADTEEEAVEKAKAGDYDTVDSEPGPKLLRPNWTAREGWAYGPGHPRL